MSDYLSSIFGLKDKVVALTGAGGFLVGELSRAAGRADMAVVCCDAKLEHAERTAEDIVKAGGRVIAVQVDVRLKGDHERALSEACARLVVSTAC